MHFNGIQSFKKWVCLSIASMGLVACGGGSADSKTAAASGANNQAAASGASNAGKEGQTINFGIINTESSQNLKTDWEPFLADMSKKTGLNIKPFFASDYAGVIQAMRFKKVDLAWYGNKSAMEAVDRADGEVFAQTINNDGTTGYYSLMIVNADSPYKTEQDVLKDAGKLTFANGDPNSTSGNLVPGYYVFAKNNVDATKIFKRTLNANHESNAMAVANKQVDVGTFNTEGWAMMEKKNPDIVKKLKIVWKSPEIPSDPLVWRKDMDDANKQKIKSFLMSYGSTPEEKKVLDALGWSKFRESNNEQLKPIRELEEFKKQAAAKAA